MFKGEETMTDSDTMMIASLFFYGWIILWFIAIIQWNFRCFLAGVYSISICIFITYIVWACEQKKKKENTGEFKK